MLNNFTISSDGVCIYVTIEVRAKLIAKITLLLVTIGIFTILATATINLEGREVGKNILPIIGLSFLAFYTIGRYTLWNFFGKEFLTINTKSISYQYDYGFFLTNLVTKEFTRLTVDYEDIWKEKGLKTGKVLFLGYTETDLPELLKETTLFIKEEEAEMLLQHIDKLFKDRYSNNLDFPGLSLN